MGPPSSSLIAMAIVAQSGEETIKPSPESEMSKRRFSIFLGFQNQIKRVTRPFSVTGSGLRSAPA